MAKQAVQVVILMVMAQTAGGCLPARQLKYRKAPAEAISRGKQRLTLHEEGAGKSAGCWF